MVIDVNMNKVYSLGALEIIITFIILYPIEDSKKKLF